MEAKATVAAVMMLMTIAAMTLTRESGRGEGERGRERVIIDDTKWLTTPIRLSSAGTEHSGLYYCTLSLFRVLVHLFDRARKAPVKLLHCAYVYCLAAIMAGRTLAVASTVNPKP